MIERHSLGSIKTALRAEFGLEDTTSVNELLNGKINESLGYIVRYRNGRWRWLRKEAALDIPASTSCVISFTNKSSEAVVTSGTVPTVRQCLYVGNRRYLVTAVNGTTLTISPKYLGATGSETTVVATVYLALPEDFVAIETKDLVTDITGKSFKAYDTQRFQLLRNRDDKSIDIAYCILMDPISDDRAAKYIAIHPYFTEDNAIQFVYYGIPTKLVNDSDEPPMDLPTRGILLNVALWFVAVSLGHDKALTYRDTALDELGRAKADFDEDDTHEFTDSARLTLDLSATEDYEFNGDSDFAPVTIT